MPNTLIFLLSFRTVSARIELIFVSMESTCSERFFSSSLDEAECYLYPKRIKVESNQKSIEKEEKQKLEQSIRCVNRYQTSPHEPVYLSERQKRWPLEKQSCDKGRKTCMREFFHFQTCSNDRLPCRVLENKLSTKKRSPENEDRNTIEDDISSNVCGQSLHVWSAADTYKNLHIRNPPQVQWNNNIEQNNKRNGDNELKQNSSVTPLDRDFFQMEILNHKSVSDKKWKQYQLLQIPFLCGTSSVFSHIEDEKNNFLKNPWTTEDKDYSSNDSETTTEKDSKEKDFSSYIIPTVKSFKNVPPLEIPNFQFPSISNKINNKMSPTNLKEMDWKSFKGHSSLTQSNQMYGVQKISEIGKQRLQNDKSSIKASTDGSEFKEKNYQSTSKEEYGALAEGRKVSVTYFRDNNTDTECDQIFAENYFKDEELENSDGDDDDKSRIHIYISAQNVQNEECIICNDLSKRMGRKRSNETVATFHIQTNIPVITEASEKNKIDIHRGVHSSNSDISLYEAESKLSTKEINYFQRCLAKNIIFKRNCPCIIVQNFPDTKVSLNIFRGKEMFKLKFSFENMLFGWVRTGTTHLHKDVPVRQDESVKHWFCFHETLNEQCGVQELVKSNINRNDNNRICICLLAVISKHLKVELLKTILSSFFNSRNTLLPTEGKSGRVENHHLCGRKQVQLNSFKDNTLRQNRVFRKKNEAYPGFVRSKFVESIGFESHNEFQRRHFSRSLGEEDSAFLKRGTIFYNQKSGLSKGKHVRKHHLSSRGTKGFVTYLRSVSHKNGTKKHILVAKCLILLQGMLDCSSLDNIYCCNITKIQYLIGANLRFWNYFPAYSQLKFEKVTSKCTNQEISVATVKQEKKKPTEMFNSYFHGERFKAFPFVLCENENHETTRCKNFMKSTDEVTNEATFNMKRYLGTSSYIKADREERVKSKELQINSDNFLSEKSCPIFDTYEKIPLSTDSEDFDQIPVVNQGIFLKNNLSEKYAVTSSEEVHTLPHKSNDVLILPKQSKTSMEKCISLLLQDSQSIKPEYCEKIDTYSPHLANKNEKVENQNTYLDFENLFPSSSNVYQSVTLPSDSSSFANEDGIASEDGHCRSSLSTDKQKQSDKTLATTGYQPAGFPTMTDTYLQFQAEVTVQFPLQGHTQARKAVGLEPATLKQHLEYVNSQEEISGEQMHVTNESQCETVLNDLIMPYSEDESKTFIAAEEKIKVDLSIMNNGCLEDVKDKYLPLENKITYEFELKRKFDLVLEELRMFHEISKGNENNLSSLETNSHNNCCELNNSERIDENVKSGSQKKISISSHICDTIEEQNVSDSSDSSLNENISNENEDQKVSKEYCISRLSGEEFLHSPIAEGKHKELFAVMLISKFKFYTRFVSLPKKFHNNRGVFIQLYKVC